MESKEFWNMLNPVQKALFILFLVLMPFIGSFDGIAYADEYETTQPDDFMQLGVVEYNGVYETWYSSNVAYHYLTDEWTLDDAGYYRTIDGYYVVASDGYEQGAIIETSRGLAQVLDCGCGSNVDFYVNW